MGSPHDPWMPMLILAYMHVHGDFSLSILYHYISHLWIDVPSMSIPKIDKSTDFWSNPAKFPVFAAEISIKTGGKLAAPCAAAAATGWSKLLREETLWRGAWYAMAEIGRQYI